MSITKASSSTSERELKENLCIVSQEIDDLNSNITTSTANIQNDILEMNLEPSTRALAATLTHMLMLKMDPWMAETGRKLKTLEGKIDSIETKISSVRKPLHMTAMELLRTQQSDPANGFPSASASSEASVSAPPAMSLLAERAQKLAVQQAYVEETKRTCVENHQPFLLAVTEKLEKGDQEILENSLMGKQMAAVKEVKDKKFEAGKAMGKKLIDIMPELRTDGSGGGCPESLEAISPEERVAPTRTPCVRCRGQGYWHSVTDSKKKHPKGLLGQCKFCSSCESK
jgi:cytochrome c1